MKVLVVEDSPLHQKVINKILSMTLPGVEIISSLDPYDGFAALVGLQGKVGMIIMDHNMPYGTGAALLEKIRRTDWLKNIPVVIMTGEDFPKEDFLALGANAYFGKPFDPNQFREVARNLGMKTKKA
jgi:CheY-like chemotaxis protein